MIDKWKVLTSKSSSEHAGQADKNGVRRVFRSLVSCPRDQLLLRPMLSLAHMSPSLTRKAGAGGN